MLKITASKNIKEILWETVLIKGKLSKISWGRLNKIKNFEKIGKRI